MNKSILLTILLSALTLQTDVRASAPAGSSAAHAAGSQLDPSVFNHNGFDREFNALPTYDPDVNDPDIHIIDADDEFLKTYHSKIQELRRSDVIVSVSVRAYSKDKEDHIRKAMELANQGIHVRLRLDDKDLSKKIVDELTQRWKEGGTLEIILDYTSAIEVPPSLLMEAMTSLNITRVRVFANEVSDEFMNSLHTLLGSKNCKLRDLYFVRFNLTPQQIEVLEQALRRNNSLQELRLSGLDALGVVSIAGALHENHKLKKLSLDCTLEAEEAKALAVLLEKNTTLQELSLECPEFNEREMGTLANGLSRNRLSSLRKLLLETREGQPFNLEGEGVEALQRVVRESHSLQEVILKHYSQIDYYFQTNTITKQGIKREERSS